MNLKKHQQPDIDKIYLYVKEPFESKCQFLINGREKVGIKTLKNSKEFTDYSQTIDYVYENLEDHNPTKKRKVLIVFDDIIVGMESNEKIKPYSHGIVFKRKKAHYFACFYITILFKSPKTIRLNATHYFFMKIPNKKELRQ